MSKFDDLESAPPTPKRAVEKVWQEWGLSTNKDRIPHNNLDNAATILESDPQFKDTVYYDEFLQRVIRRNSPEREWREEDDLEATRYIQAELGLVRMSRDIVSQAVISVAHKNPRNCVQEWLGTLQHDGERRLEAFFSDHFGAAENEYTQAASKNFWLSLVARAFKPGCKVDNMIVLEGSQGVGKSQALGIIAGDWFAEQHESAINPKAFAEILQGKLLIEVSEMESFNKQEVNRVKQTVSCSSDRFRASYGRYAVDHPRTCIFVGTTNRDDWNRDETGARRFWPIACAGTINLDAIRESRNQYFAEAVVRFRANERHWEMPLNLATEEQEARYQRDPWHNVVVHKLKGKDQTTTAEILGELDFDVKQQGRAEQMRVGQILRVLGLRRVRRLIGTTREWVYVPPVVGHTEEGRVDNNLFDSM